MKTQKNDSALQLQLTSELQKLNWNAARIAGIIALIVIPLSMVWDYLIIPQYFMLFLIGRTIMFAASALVVALIYTRKFSGHGDIASLLIVLIICLGVTVLLHIIGTTHSYYAMLLLMLLATLIIPWTVRYCIIVVSVILAAYAVPPLFINPAIYAKPEFFNNIGFLIETDALVIIITILQSRIRNKEILGRLISEKQTEELELRDRYKREFISNITHELKTPLSIVIGNVEIIMEHLGQKKPALLNQARLVQQAAFQLANHVDRIITISSIDDPQVKLNLENYNYNGIVQNVTSPFMPKAANENIIFTVNVPEQPLVVNCDVVRIEEALTNLVQNAFKFTNAGGSITVTVACDGHNVVTEVADTGVGIAPDRLERIFERMFQADDVLSKRHGGIGLGLYIVKKSVELQGGSITVHSVEGKGSSFRIVLPLYIDQTVQVKNREFEGEDRREQPRRSDRDRRADERRKMFEYQQSMGLDDLARMSFDGNIDEYENQNPSRPGVLIVEDNGGMMKVIVESLRHSYNLFLARDAFSALDKLAQYSGRIALILSDVMMPGMSGFDFCKQIMENKEWKGIPLIFVTAMMDEEKQLEGFSLGATDYITKPYSIKILKEKVDHWISRRQYETLLENMSHELEMRVQQASRMKDIVLHEIRNPMAIITGAESLIKMVRQNKGADKEIEHYLDMLQKGVLALQDVMETSRQLDGSTMAVRKPESVEGLLSDAMAQTRHLLGTTTLKIEADKALGLRVLADRRMLVQVLVNIIRNATEAITEKRPAEGGQITVACAPYGTKQFTFSIADNGAGMDDSMKERVFSFRYTTKKDGNGVGLHLSKMIVKVHEGQITVDSKKGAGTTFTIYLPVC